MTRLTENVLIQRADDLIVFLDENDGEEVTFPAALALQAAVILRVLVRDLTGDTDESLVAISKATSTKEVFPHMTEQSEDWAKEISTGVKDTRVPGYDYDPVPTTSIEVFGTTLIEVFGTWLNPTYVETAWVHPYDGKAMTTVRFTDGHVIRFEQSIEQVVAAINQEMR